MCRWPMAIWWHFLIVAINHLTMSHCQWPYQFRTIYFEMKPKKNSSVQFIRWLYFFRLSHIDWLILMFIRVSHILFMCFLFDLIKYIFGMYFVPESLNWSTSKFASKEKKKVMYGWLVSERSSSRWWLFFLIKIGAMLHKNWSPRKSHKEKQ